MDKIHFKKSPQSLSEEAFEYETRRTGKNNFMKSTFRTLPGRILHARPPARNSIPARVRFSSVHAARHKAMERDVLFLLGRLPLAYFMKEKWLKNMTMIYYSRKIFLLDRDFHFQTHEVYEMCLNSYKNIPLMTHWTFSPKLQEFSMLCQHPSLLSCIIDLILMHCNVYHSYLISFVITYIYVRTYIYTTSARFRSNIHVQHCLDPCEKLNNLQLMLSLQVINALCEPTH